MFHCPYCNSNSFSYIVYDVVLKHDVFSDTMRIDPSEPKNVSDESYGELRCDECDEIFEYDDYSTDSILIYYRGRLVYNEPKVT